MELIKSNFDIKYWRSKNGEELDFVISKDNRIVAGVEAKSSNKKSNSYIAFKNMYKGIETKIVNQDNVCDLILGLK